jgi:ubiquinone biosynthesis protein
MPFAQRFHQLRHFGRFRQISAVLIKYGFGEFLDRAGVATLYYRIRRLFFRREPEIARLNYVHRIRLALEELGPTFIKLGQVLSTRPFLIPPDLVLELSKLQDQVAPFPFKEAQQIIEKELGQPISELFSEFNQKGIASASLAQVHKARLKDETEVAVKVQRPGIKKIIDSDMRILRVMADLAVRHIPESRQYDPQGLVDELAKTTRQELDFVNEGQNIEIFRSNFADCPEVVIPKVYWELTTPLVLTTQFIHGTKVSDLAALKLKGLNPRVIAQRGAELVCKQIFDYGFFHADPHPGNILILDGNVIAPLDFGMVGTLTESQLEEFSDILEAFVAGDAKKIVRVLLESEIVDEKVNLRRLEIDVSAMLQKIKRQPLGRLNMKDLFWESFEIFKRYDMKAKSELMLLSKAMVTYEELARSLDPEFQMAEVVKPYVSKLIKKKFAPGQFVKETISGISDLRKLASDLPFEVKRILQKSRKGEMSVELRHRDLDKLILELDRSSNRLSFALVIAAIIVGSSLIIKLEIGYKVFGFSVLGLLGFLFAGILGVGLVIAILRSGRL